MRLISWRTATHARNKSINSDFSAKGKIDKKLHSDFLNDFPELDWKELPLQPLNILGILRAAWSKWTKFSIGYLQPRLSRDSPIAVASGSQQPVTAGHEMPEVPGFCPISRRNAGHQVSTWLSFSTLTRVFHNIRGTIRNLIIVQINLLRNRMLPNRDLSLIH